MVSFMGGITLWTLCRELTEPQLAALRDKARCGDRASLKQCLRAHCGASLNLGDCLRLENELLRLAALVAQVDALLRRRTAALLRLRCRGALERPLLAARAGQHALVEEHGVERGHACAHQGCAAPS